MPSGANAVVTETDCTVYRLSEEALERLCKTDPDLALALYQFLLRLLAERLTSTSNMLRGFQEQGAQRAREKKTASLEPGIGRTPVMANGR